MDPLSHSGDPRGVQILAAPPQRVSQGTGTLGDPRHLTAGVGALVGVVGAVGDAVAEVAVGDAVGAQGAGELPQPAAPVAAQLIAAVQAVGLAVAQPAPRRALPALARELVGTTGGSWRCHPGVPQ